MKHTRSKQFFTFLLVTTLLLSWGCATGKSKSSTFYLLKTLPGAEEVSLEPGGVSVGIGPIVVPAYLDRTQIATTGNDHQLHMNEFHRWAEPLKDSFGRVLAENLSILLKTPNVYIYPLRRNIPIDYQVEMTISHFFADDDGSASLVAYWSLLGDNGRTALLRKRSSFTEKAASGKLGDIVAAQNQTLQALSREIAAEIQKTQ
jgi:uncharacterized lipoprotein YmbA